MRASVPSVQRLAVAGGLLCEALFSLSASDWPQWRGPNRDGISKEELRIPPWPESGPRVIWRAEVGTGFSSVSIHAGRAYTMGNVANQDIVWCLDARDGHVIWKHTYACPLGAKYYEGGPGATPTVHGDRVFTLSKQGHLLCLDAATGRLVWQRDLSHDPGLKPNEWGFAGSPLVYENLLLLNCGREGTAVDWRSGEVIWFNGQDTAAYASPVLFDSGNETLALIFCAPGLSAVEPRTGRVRWRFPWKTGWDNNNADPIVEGRTIFITSYDRGAALLEATSDNVQARYVSKAMFTHMAPPVKVGEYLYGFSGHYARKPDFRCVHMPSGKVQWTQPNMPAGSVLGVGRHLLVLDGKGRLWMIRPTPGKFDPVAQAQVMTGRCWTPPTLVNGLLYVRNARGRLVCLRLAE